MPIFEVDVIEESYVTYIVEADDKEEVRRKIRNGEVQETKSGIDNSDSDIVDIREVQ